MAIKLGDAGTIDHFGLTFQYQIKKIFKKRMDKSNHKLKILQFKVNASRLIPVSYGSIYGTYHQLKSSSPSPTAPKKRRQEKHKRAYLSENGGLGKNTM